MSYDRFTHLALCHLASLLSPFPALALPSLSLPATVDYC